MLMCPRCQVNPSRQTRALYRGKIPFCWACHRALREANQRAQAARRKAERAAALPADLREPERGTEDLSPAEIDRVFREALAEIRKRPSEWS